MESYLAIFPSNTSYKHQCCNNYCAFIWHYILHTLFDNHHFFKQCRAGVLILLYKPRNSKSKWLAYLLKVTHPGLKTQEPRSSDCYPRPAFFFSLTFLFVCFFNLLIVVFCLPVSSSLSVCFCLCLYLSPPFFSLLPTSAHQGLVGTQRGIEYKIIFP